MLQVRGGKRERRWAMGSGQWAGGWTCAVGSTAGSSDVKGTVVTMQCSNEWGTDEVMLHDSCRVGIQTNASVVVPLLVVGSWYLEMGWVVVLVVAVVAVDRECKVPDRYMQAILCRLLTAVDG